MSCLRLRFSPAKKAWKIITSKLHTKLISKLHPPKTVYKQRSRTLGSSVTSRAKNKSPLAVKCYPQSHKRHHVKRSHSPIYTLSVRHPQRQIFKKRHAPVYVDKLFREPIQDDVVLCSRHDPKACTVSTGTEKLAVGSDPSTANHIYQGRVDDERNDSAADDMWEAVGLASPLMHGIDERAEEFIAKFRAEMERQESIARNL